MVENQENIKEEEEGKYLASFWKWVIIGVDILLAIAIGVVCWYCKNN